MKPSQHTHDTNTNSLGTVPREVQRVPTLPTISGTCPHARSGVDRSERTQRPQLTHRLRLHDTAIRVQLDSALAAPSCMVFATPCFSMADRHSLYIHRAASSHAMMHDPTLHPCRGYRGGFCASCAVLAARRWLDRLARFRADR
jgi:hypothetical protein